MNSLLSKRKTLWEMVEREKEELIDAKEAAMAIATAQGNLQAIAESVQAGTHKQIAKIVSKCLTAVFDRPYELKILLERRRGKTEIDFVYERDGHRVNPHMTSGGVKEVASIALRLASLMLTLPIGEKFLCLDEPFSGVSKTNIPKMSLLLKTLSEELDFQFLISTHSDTLKVGKVVNLG